jgi:ESCRT-II complex subunit VPS25
MGAFSSLCHLVMQLLNEHVQAVSTGQINTILTFYEITDPPIPSDLSDLPAPLLRSAIAILAKTGRAQTITISDGDGVRFFERRA